MIDQRFELIEPLGSGGMGTVWRAYDIALHREVALKEVRDDQQGGAQRERVLREARALARIGHPNVVAIHHIVDSPAEKHPWIVMELVRGGSLADRLAAGPLPPDQAARIGRGILAALRAAHAVGVLHRDVKPANVLLRQDDSPVLTDFGIAALSDMTGLTSTGSVVGSLNYVAPERLGGREGLPASDLWSLGLVLFTAVEGYQPMQRETSVATLAAVLKGEVPQPQRSGPLTPVLTALLVPDPDSRPTAEALDHMLAHTAERPYPFTPPPPQISPTSTTYTSTPSSPYTAGPQHDPSSTSAPQHFSAGPTHTPGQAHPPAGPGHAFCPQHDSSSGSTHTSAPQHFSAGTTHTPGQAHPPAGTDHSSGRVHSSAGPTHSSGPHFSAGSVHPSGQRDSSAYPHGPQSPVRSRRGWAVAGVAVLASGAILAVFGLVLLRSTPSAPEAGGADQPVPSQVVGPASIVAPSATARITAAPPVGEQSNLLTPEGMRAAVAALEKAAGGQQFTETTIYPGYVNTGAPVAGQPGLFDRFSYRNGKAARSGPGGQLTDPTIALGSVDWSVLPKLFDAADQQLRIPHPTSRYVIVDPAWTFNDNRPSLLIYLSDDYGGAYLAADLDGTIVRTYPRK
ncbi:serine/threonine-protein kinase [Nocardia pseudobrasiliensis]|uniref:non-specific serine/threonine protein kinase n=1 Tax=Nocardia pseudobrasiliensis TaxID=45979 RepID=A0A370ICQ5_9NOCA|nr:serine/threonine-protein kinase [Nocardia pseudobrasiliensis]RDI68509.1 serine/threonine protein kinase [Nocardia pseudobrasiliensis]